MVRRVKKIQSTRNLCVIAHVDHGKTTLSDSFLSRAGLLYEDKAGTTLALDTDKEEIERGITIKSTGITLNYPDIVPRGLDTTAPETSGSPPPAPKALKAPKAAKAPSLNPARSAIVYVGNLPFVKAEEEPEREASILAYLADSFGAHGQVTDIGLRSRRGFANVTFATQEAADAALAHTAQHPLQYEDRILVVERQHEGAVHLLEQACKERSIAAPVYTLVAEHLYEVAIPGTEILARPSASAPTQKDAKRDAAALALHMLEPDSKAETETEDSSADAAAAAASASAVEDDDEESLKGLIVNLIDCPGHVDFSGEVTAALRITDGALVVVDCVEGVGVQTETVLRQALAERVRPVLFLNKVDRVMGELQCAPEDAYQRFVRTIASVNAIIEMYQPAGLDFTVSPEAGTVGFGSGLHGWGFTLPQFARLLCKDKGDAADPKKLAARLWGDYYHDKAAGKWRKEPVLGDNGAPIERTFCEKILRPIYKLHEAEREGRAEELAELAAKLGVTFRPSVWEEMSLKDRRKAVFKRWIPVADSLLDMANEHLPNPIEAQAYRAAHLYEGEEDDPVCHAMKRCDPDGPVMVYIAKLVPASAKASNKSMIAFGRVFSGTLGSGQPIRVLGPAYQPGDKADMVEAKVQSVVQMMADRQASLAAAPAGCIIGILGIDKALTKSATLTDDPTAFPMKMMKFSVSPVVRVAVTTSKPSDHAKLHAAMQRLVKYDATVQAFFDDATGEKIIAGVGELHVEVCIKKLAEFAGVEVVCKEPVVQYCETASTEGETCMAKSGNKHNRLFVNAAPLTPELTAALEAGSINMQQALNVRVNTLAEEHGWDRNVARKIMAISGTNMMVDCTTGIDLSPIRELVVLAFSELCDRSVLANEPMRGVCFKVMDAKMHADSPHRRADQIVPMAKRALSAALLSAAPRLYEPIFSVEVQIPDAHLGALRRVLKDRRGKISEDLPVYGTPLHIVKAFLPVASSFGFVGDLQGSTSGHAFANTAFSHWQAIEGDVSSTAAGSSELADLVKAIRVRKGLKADIPTADQFYDRL